MNVLFVHTPIPGARFSTSIAALSAWLRRHGHDTALLVVPHDAAPEATRELFRDADPDVIALSYMTCRADHAAAIAHVAKDAAPLARLIAGGAHPTTYPHETLAALPLDAVCVGEGEAPLLHFVEHPGEAHPGLVRRDHADAITRWWAPDVDDLPDWDRALFGDVRNDGNRFERAVGVALARGFCPYTCTFCGVDGYRRLNKPPAGPSHRLRTVGRVLDELRRAREVVPCPDGFAAWDEILPGGRAYIRDLMLGYRDAIGLPFACQLRIEQVKPDLVESLVLGGCDYAVVGVETGDEAYRKRFLDKPFTNERVREAFSMLHAAGIQTFGSFMIGLPFETPAMLRKTVELARDIAPTHLSWKYYTPERGTRLFGLLEQHDLVVERWVDHPFGGEEPMIRLTHCTERDLGVATSALQMLAAGAERPTFSPRAFTLDDAGRGGPPLTLELRT